MKNKIIKSLVIFVIGVSIVFLLGIFTKAFAQSHHILMCHWITSKCYAPLHYKRKFQNKNQTPIVGYLQSGIKVNSIEEFSNNNVDFVKIKLDYNNEFWILKELLYDCKNEPDGKICTIVN
ncbi:MULTISPECIES: hypothetical protein [unclassified Moorena]|uniref:hypothetical protein n=1 Tax=unclassified Moorena TaxID=2683338 RepID=UPI0013C83FD5|nr:MULTISPECIES: hypothetical protein [unclassified Moorena]NEO20660.1 hypothetical protein [Moorena sp. SIO4A5]NEQ59096.1 hypothetical protein [Moorena sp. SIO4A1]